MYQRSSKNDRNTLAPQPAFLTQKPRVRDHDLKRTMPWIESGVYVVGSIHEARNESLTNIWLRDFGHERPKWLISWFVLANSGMWSLPIKVTFSLFSSILFSKCLYRAQHKWCSPAKVDIVAEERNNIEQVYLQKIKKYLEQACAKGASKSPGRFFVSNTCVLYFDERPQKMSEICRQVSDEWSRSNPTWIKLVG